MCDKYSTNDHFDLGFQAQIKVTIIKHSRRGDETRHGWAGKNADVQARAPSAVCGGAPLGLRSMRKIPQCWFTALSAPCSGLFVTWFVFYHPHPGVWSGLAAQNGSIRIMKYTKAPQCLKGIFWKLSGKNVKPQTTQFHSRGALGLEEAVQGFKSTSPSPHFLGLQKGGTDTNKFGNLNKIPKLIAD